ncbi:MAG: hypothetical protein DMG04_20500 [Acidobacteria bacterium]|nr:MAG: hypothetical protein DMG04_20500 [Acidobacteriota bacterium]
MRFSRRLGAEQLLNAAERRCLETDVSRTPPGGLACGRHLAAKTFAGALRALLIPLIVRAQADEQPGE